MLNLMRDNLRHLKWVLVVVAFAMLLYLGAYFDPRSYAKGGGQDWAAKVDGDVIPTQDFMLVAQRQEDEYKRLLSGQYDQVKKNLKIGSQSIRGMIERKLVLEDAKSLGLSATREEISKAILDNPSFKDASGKFIGKDRYTELVSQNVDGGVQEFEQELADHILRLKWLSVVTSGASVSDAELKRLWTTRNVHVAADYVFVPTASATFDTKVSPAEAQAWYAAHQNDYKRSEARKVRLVIVERQSFVPQVKLSDAEIKADYDQHVADYARPEQRRASHILFKVPAGAAEADKKAVRDLANSVLARAKKGEDFAALARSMSQDPASAAQGGDLGWFRRGAMVKPFDDAAFSTAPGQFAPVVETDFGFHVIKVVDARDAGTSPFEEVKDSIRKRLELQRAQDLAAAAAQKLQAEVKSPADLDAAAAKAGLKVEDRVLSPEDRAGDLGASPEFNSAVAALPAGQVSAPLGVARGFAIVACTEVLPPAVRPISEVMDRVTGDALNERGRQAALAMARRVVAASTLDAGAKTAKLEVKKSGDLSSGAPFPGAGRSPELDAALFGPSARVGEKGAVITPGGAVAFEITRHDTFDPAKFEGDKETLREEVLQQQREAMSQSLIELLRQKHSVEINQAVVDRVDG